MPEPGRALPRLTALRALAALWVFGYHTGFDLRLPFGVRWFADGYCGVSFFFVLSGFVLTWVARRGDRAGTFFRRRFARIYPAYVVATVVALVITPAPWAAAAATFGMVKAWFAVVPSGARAITFLVNPPSWTLSCEAAFYLVFPVMMWARYRVDWRSYSLAMVGWSVLCLEGSVLALRIGSAKQGVDIAYFTPFLRVGEFALGSGICVALQSGWRPRIPLIPTGCAMVAAAYIVRQSDVGLPKAEWLLLPMFGLVIAAAAIADLDDRRGLLRWRPFVYAGEVSYAFYIVQFPIVLEAFKHVHTPARSSLFALAGTSLAAVVLHHAVERPFQRLLSGRRAARPKPVGPDRSRSAR